jgi:hypothetical protein
VVSLLTEGAEALPSSGALGPFWRRLAEHRHDFKLAVPNVFMPDGDEVVVKSDLGGEKDNPEARKVCSWVLK